MSKQFDSFEYVDINRVMLWKCSTCGAGYQAGERGLFCLKCHPVLAGSGAAGALSQSRPEPTTRPLGPRSIPE